MTLTTGRHRISRRTTFATAGPGLASAPGGMIARDSEQARADFDVPFHAVSQLRITLPYDIPQEVQEQRRAKAGFLPEKKSDPLTGHDDFADVRSNQIMNRVVDCINQGRDCNE